jgi:asparagine synthetase B (glutamine-hydrolysing)
MRITYKYKDFVTDDIREIVKNNRLIENTDYIEHEYLPYQIFISRETFFKGVTIEVDEAFDPTRQSKTKELPFDKIFEGKPTVCGAACSGGIDSSTVSIKVKPDHIYTGYYREPGFSEVPFAQSVADQINAMHWVYEITESEFINKLDQYISTICTPIAGLGGVAEYICLEKFVSDTGIREVYFGNGGDEVFMGYFYNHLIKNLMDVADKPHEYMDNFKPYRKSFVYGNLNLMIERLVNRGAQYNGKTALIKRLEMTDDITEKMLDININCTLPSLLHINQMMCKANGVNGYNPLSSQLLFDHAKELNNPMTDRPKAELVRMAANLPKAVTDRKDKAGFPIPLNTWNNLGEMMRESVERRREVFTGINRRAWGMFMIDRWRVIYGR